MEKQGEAEGKEQNVRRDFEPNLVFWHFNNTVYYVTLVFYLFIYPSFVQLEMLQIKLTYWAWIGNASRKKAGN